MRELRAASDAVRVVRLPGEEFWRVTLFDREVGRPFSHRENALSIASFLRGSWKDIQIIASDHEADRTARLAEATRESIDLAKIKASGQGESS